jgi:hypothetical protein
MQSHRFRIVHALVIALACQFASTAFAQEPPAAAAAAPVQATISLDAANRSLRLEPRGLSIRFPDGMAVSDFSGFGERASLMAKAPGGLTVFMDLAVILRGTPLDCASWDANINKDKRKPSDKGGPNFDPRWVGNAPDKNDLNVCLVVPGGVVTIEGQEIDKAMKQPFVQFTANIADAFLPQTAETGVAAAAAVAAPPAPALASVDNLYPDNVLAASDYCSMGYQMQCEFVASFEPIYQGCRNDNVKFCKQIGKWAADSKKKEDYFVAATYYRRACQLGDTASCKLADKFQKLDRESLAPAQ